MIVDSGKVQLLSDQLTALETYQWFLFDTNVSITSATVWTDLSEASFAGYVRQNVAMLSSPVIVATRAFTQPGSPPSFPNTSGADQTVWGWGLVAVSGTVLISAVNHGAVVIPAGLQYILSAAITDTQE